jgi:hypothetical protein
MLYIHIGFRKTGSTTIQGFLSRNAKALERAGLLYPKAGLAGRAHFNLLNQLRGREFKPEKGGLAEVQAAIRQNPNHDTIISCEGFHNSKPQVISKLASGLGVENVRIIAYIRHLSHLVVSSYMQTTKTGHTVKNFDEFFGERIGNDASEYRVHMYRQLEAWANVYGWERLRVRALEPQHLEGQDLLTDLLDAVGRGWEDIPQLDQETTMRRNVSPGWKAVELLRALNVEFGRLKDIEDPELHRNARRTAGRVRRAAEEIADELDLNVERGAYLTEDQWELCDNAYRDVVHRLNLVLQGPAIPLGSARAPAARSFLPEASKVPADERAAFFQRLCYRLMSDGRAAAHPPADEKESGGDGGTLDVVRRRGRRRTA